MSDALEQARWRPADQWSPPRADEVDVWLVDLDREDERGVVLSSDEAARAGRLLLPEKRRQFRNARSALRHVLARALARPAAELRFAYGEHGRPLLLDHPIAFNLSHSGRWALVAVAAQGDLGVDVEETATGRPLDRLAERFFSPDERRRYRRLPAAERRAAFYRAWTLKEAYVKALGTGLSFSSRRFTVDFEAEAGGALLRATGWEDGDLDWWFELLPVPAGYRGAVCWRGGERSVRLHRFG